MMENLNMGRVIKFAETDRPKGGHGKSVRRIPIDFERRFFSFVVDKHRTAKEPLLALDFDAESNLRTFLRFESMKRMPPD